jgi:3-deoxy-manno-octulosonate cytidylyltransferase (CMP-KDO synthetase)
MNFLGIIPSRYDSVRFPGKPLALIGQKPMIQWVYERCSKELARVYVATDDQRIVDAVEGFGGKVVMTSRHHRSGTDRCMEALGKIRAIEHENWDVVINIQGDEPFINTEQLRLLQSCFDARETDIATLVKRIEDSEDIFDTNKPKVVFDMQKFALLFSRSPIPYVRGENAENWLNKFEFHRHIGIYAYRSEILEKITRLQPSELEKAESLEQLRWLENGFRIKVEITEYGPLGVDTPEDLEKARMIIERGEK